MSRASSIIEEVINRGPLGLIDELYDPRWPPVRVAGSRHFAKASRACRWRSSS
jgi:hypothetical protein